MDIEGTYTLQAMPEAVWNCLMDQQTLRRCIPGIERLEVLDDHTWAFALNVKHAPLMGTYQGQAALLEQKYPNHYRITFQGEGRQSTFSGKWAMDLRGYEANTIVVYKGTIQFGKRAGNAYMAPLVKGTLKLLFQQFFIGLTDQLRVTSHMQSVITSDVSSSPEDIASSLRLHPPMAEILTPDNWYQVRASTRGEFPQHRFLHAIVHRLGLGEDDPVVEEQWVNRIRRFGIASVLMLLVWVGTRIPRKILD